MDDTASIIEFLKELEKLIRDGMISEGVARELLDLL